jgi:hypothetical protein
VEVGGDFVGDAPPVVDPPDGGRGVVLKKRGFRPCDFAAFW